MAKPKTSYANPTKPSTSYSVNPSAQSSVLLGDTSVKLNSTVVLLSGYTGATPNQLSTKPKTAYAEV